MGLNTVINKIKDFFGLRDSFAVLKVVGVSNPPPKYYPDLEKYLHSGVGQSVNGVISWWQGGNTPDGKETIELIFYSDVVTVDRIIEQLKKEGLFTESLKVKIKTRT